MVSGRGKPLLALSAIHDDPQGAGRDAEEAGGLHFTVENDGTIDAIGEHT